MVTNKRQETTVEVLALCHLAGVSPRLMEVLIYIFGNTQGILGADEATLATIDGMSARAAEKIASASLRLEEAEELYGTLRDRDIGITSRFDHDYPRLLFELNDPPPLLYTRGHLPDNDRKTVLLTGAEEATNEGIELTVRLAKLFGQADVQMIASLSKGIDAAAHVGACTAGCDSYGVLDSGFDHIHPEEHLSLALDIAQSGGIITECPPQQAYHPDKITAANRLLAGLAQAVVITELYADSQRALDLLSFCRQIGKLTFFMAADDCQPLADEKSLQTAIECGAILMTSPDQAGDIVRTLV
ncbi:MAG: DNA-processing protein DprA [bacterium]